MPTQTRRAHPTDSCPLLTDNIIFRVSGPHCINIVKRRHIVASAPHDEIIIQIKSIKYSFIAEIPVDPNAMGFLGLKNRLSNIIFINYDLGLITEKVTVKKCFYKA